MWGIRLHIQIATKATLALPLSRRAAGTRLRWANVSASAASQRASSCTGHFGLWRTFQPSSAQDGAAWAQAISSVAAVAAALFVVIWQHHLQTAREEQARKQARAERFEAAFQLGEYLRVVADKVINHAAGELQAIGVALEKCHPADFASYRELKPLVAVMSATSALHQQLKHAMTMGDAHGASALLTAGFGGALESIVANVADLRLVADEARFIAGMPVSRRATL
jgi:hypothetical protein